MQNREEREKEHFKIPNAILPIIPIDEHMPQSECELGERNALFLQQVSIPIRL